jgi:hypothetical protein
MSIASDGYYDSSRQSGDMGNLADELADAWEDDAVEEAGSSFLDGLREGSVEPSTMQDEVCSGNQQENVAFYDIRSPASPSRRPVHSDAWSPSSARLTRKRTKSPIKKHEKSELQYDGSDYGAESDLEGAEGISPALIKEMAHIEALARRGLDEEAVSEAGGIVTRTTAALKYLGPQSSIENGATRMITAFTSIASHRTRKTREIFSLAHTLLLEKFPTLSEAEIDEMIPDMDLLIQYLQLPAGSSLLQSLQILIANTTDLAHSLRSLSDILQESRQATSAASRRLKSVRDFVLDLRQEEAAREEGIRYLDLGDWDNRIRNREASRMCGDVVNGFETTCNLWRNRLFGSTAEATPA